MVQDVGRQVVVVETRGPLLGFLLLLLLNLQGDLGIGARWGGRQYSVRFSCPWSSIPLNYFFRYTAQKGLLFFEHLRQAHLRHLFLILQVGKTEVTKVTAFLRLPSS